KAGFYGLDLYSLRSSIEAVVNYFAKIDPASARRARRRYACFDHFGGETQNYGLATGLGMSGTCEEDVIHELVELRLREFDYLQRDGRIAADEFFCAEQNALVVKNAERYYRTMFHGEVSSWNLRDRHMMDTLISLASHLEQFTSPAKIVIWAHNSHVGNALATQMRERGEFNLGQLARDRFVHHAVLIGFTTYEGTVTAASGWEEPSRRKLITPAVPESYEMVFHLTEQPRFWLDFLKHPEVTFNLRAERLERAIGVIYWPETELASHYFTARLPDQFDAVLHFDTTRAVEPLERSPRWSRREVHETFPTGV
ncbi:MAG TPA: erythromycin esterase family protein, partial [Verrucomicrobiae bacterium]|nr:erythromycin esterase family protein [Verrucomicrobiae bacterium]